MTTGITLKVSRNRRIHGKQRVPSARVLEQDKVVVDIDAALDGSKWHHATKVSKVTKIAPRDGAVDVGFVVLGQGA